MICLVKKKNEKKINCELILRWNHFVSAAEPNQNAEWKPIAFWIFQWNDECVFGVASIRQTDDHFGEFILDELNNFMRIM